MPSQNYVNHVALVLDASSSMAYNGHDRGLVKVADGLVAHLAQRSKELDQETRITVYTFNAQAKCVIYDKDVLRLPSIASLYRAQGDTALIDATLLSLDDLRLTPEKYGDHAFLVYVLTDGEENRSRTMPGTLRVNLDSLPDHWTVAALVPNMSGKHEAKKFGFPGDNIAIWDTSSAQGMAEAGEVIRTSLDNYMTARSTGIRGTKTLFGGAAQVNKATVAGLGLDPLDRGKFMLIPIPAIPDKTQIKDFVERECGLVYRIGSAFYQLSKPEKIQASKKIAVVERKTNNVYVGYEARQLLGLPDTEIRVTPEGNPEFTVFVQSMSINRHLVSHTKLLLVD